MHIENQIFYKSSGLEKEIFKNAFELKWPLLLKGPTGCGKSRFVQHMANELKCQLIEIACHEETSSVDLIGRFLIKNNETCWQDGPLIRAMRQGAILYLDEIAESREDVIVALHPVLDYRRTLFIEKTGEEVKAHPNFFIVASYNPGYQSELKELKPSTKQRFLSLAFDYLDKQSEAEILNQETHIDLGLATTLVQFANKVRSMEGLELRETISTRLLVAAALLMKQGLPKRAAIQAAVLEPLTDDRELIATLKDASALFF